MRLVMPACRATRRTILPAAAPRQRRRRTRPRLRGRAHASGPRYGEAQGLKGRDSMPLRSGFGPRRSGAPLPSGYRTPPSRTPQRSLHRDGTGVSLSPNARERTRERRLRVAEPSAATRASTACGWASPSTPRTTSRTPRHRRGRRQLGRDGVDDLLGCSASCPARSPHRTGALVGQLTGGLSARRLHRQPFAGPNQGGGTGRCSGPMVSVERRRASGVRGFRTSAILR